jgi:hypothetical protein
MTAQAFFSEKYRPKQQNSKTQSPNGASEKNRAHLLL